MAVSASARVPVLACLASERIAWVAATARSVGRGCDQRNPSWGGRSPSSMGVSSAVHAIGLAHERQVPRVSKESRTFCFPARYSSSKVSSKTPRSSNSWYALYNLSAERASSIESCVSVWMFSPMMNQERKRSERRRCRLRRK